jgi:hypothetical protein
LPDDRAGVIDPKGLISDSVHMTNANHHIHRRRLAINRLRALTTGAAVAGIAGTAAFGAVAAASWSGDPSASSATDLGAGSTGAFPANGGASSGGSRGTTNNPSTNGIAPGDIFGSVPNTGSAGGTTRVRPVQPGTARSHATSGGSH